MTAEQYLAKCRCHDSVSNKFDMCYMDAAYEAIKMAREEEREKAWKAFKSVYCSQYCGLDCEKCRNKNVQKFKELINM